MTDDQDTEWPDPDEQTHRTFDGERLQGLLDEGKSVVGLDFTGAILLVLKDTPENPDSPMSMVPANLQGANLQGVILAGGDLSGCNLREAILDGADLQRTNLRGADLTDTSLRTANLRGADFRGVAVDYSALNEAADLSQTQFDFGNYTRNGWKLQVFQKLRERGAQIVELEKFPESFQQAWVGPKTGLTLYFDGQLSFLDEFLVRVLVLSTLDDATDCKVADFHQDDTSAMITLQAANPADLRSVAQALHRRVWAWKVEQHEMEQQRREESRQVELQVVRETALIVQGQELDHLRARVAELEGLRDRFRRAEYRSAKTAEPDWTLTDELSREQALEMLIKLLSGEFDFVLSYLLVCPAFLSGEKASQATRAGELVQWGEQTPENWKALVRALQMVWNG